MKLLIDPDRLDLPGTRIYVRAQHPDTKLYGTFDICCLDKFSLLSWLRSRGGNNPWAEDTVGILLGYGPLHPLGEFTT